MAVTRTIEKLTVTTMRVSNFPEKMLTSNEASDPVNCLRSLVSVTLFLPKQRTDDSSGGSSCMQLLLLGSDDPLLGLSCALGLAPQRP